MFLAVLVMVRWKGGSAAATGAAATTTASSARGRMRSSVREGAWRDELLTVILSSAAAANHHLPGQHTGAAGETEFVQFFCHSAGPNRMYFLGTQGRVRTG